jgi:drug/metabolite transporter (DMT)-like permease
MFYQLLVISVLLVPFYFIDSGTGWNEQLPAILMLSILTTAIGHTWFLHSFKKFSVTSASIISSLQLVYGIIIGMIFLKEFPQVSTIIGGTLILMTVIVESVISYRKNNKAGIK